MTPWKFISSFYLIGFPALLWAGIYTPQCPNEIKTQEKIQDVTKGWEVVNESPPHFLSSISFYSGPPDKMAHLKPEFINNKKAKWDFSPQEPIYIVCHYNQTGIALTQPLPLKTIGCKVLFNQNVRGAQGFLPQTIQCTQ